MSTWTNLRLLPVLLALASPSEGRPEDAPDVPRLLAEATRAEAALRPAQALELYRRAEQLRPNDPQILQKIARQYSDLTEEQPEGGGRREFARQALTYAERARSLAPKDPVAVLSVAISHAKLGLYSSTREKVAHSRIVREEAERALALDPGYAWAHHVLGRWHHEVSALGRVARWWVQAFYGGLPDASAETGIRFLRRAAELEPAEPAHHVELGLALADAGQAGEARLALQRGLALPVTAHHHTAVHRRAREALGTLEPVKTG